MRGRAWGKKADGGLGGSPPPMVKSSDRVGGCPQGERPAHRSAGYDGKHTGGSAGFGPGFLTK